MKQFEPRKIEVWAGPTTEERIHEIETWAKRLAEYATKRTDWHAAGNALDGFAFATEDFGHMLARLRHHLGRCTRGHIIGPTDICSACGARLVVSEGGRE